jgi:chromosome segregation ATPase
MSLEQNLNDLTTLVERCQREIDKVTQKKERLVEDN